MPTARQSLASVDGCREDEVTQQQSGMRQTGVTGAKDEVSHTNGWVSLVSDSKVGLAYLIDLPEKMQAKMGKGKEKRQFLTEKASGTGNARDFSDEHG